MQDEGSAGPQERYECVGGCGTSGPPGIHFAWSDQFDGYICRACLNGTSPHQTYVPLEERETPLGEFYRDYVIGAGNGASRNGSKPENSRYAGRHIDLAALLAMPEQPTPWRVAGVVADGTLTTIAAESGAGKSWLSGGFCEGVYDGEPVAGLKCAQGVALYVDGEMGSAMFVGRLRSSGATGREYEYIDAMGLDVSLTADLAWLRGKIEEVGANLVVVDSLRALTPSKAENDSDDMAPVVSGLRKLARDTGAAIILIHHKGDGEKLFRGSTTIRDQSDALFGLQRFEGDPEGPLRHLWCPVKHGAKRPRYSPDAADLWVEVDPDDGTVTKAEGPAARTVPEVMSAVADMTDKILDALPFQTKKEAAEKVDRHPRNQTFVAAWKGLRVSKRMVRMEDANGVSAWHQTLGTTTTHSPLNKEEDDK
jgi:hypothetical protein